ncbi:MAG: argininosuccinate lyase [Candidatus Omnitrophota bacterium]
MAKKLWGGRFDKKTDPSVEEFAKSIHYDYKLAEYDIIGSRIHVAILKNSGYLTNAEAIKLAKALDFIAKSITNGTFRYDRDAEDIHTDIQNLLQERVKDLALKLHTARSRNDQVVFATKLYCHCAALEVDLKVKELSWCLKELALKDDNRSTIIPGFTHMQHAQPVYLKDYLWAYRDMLGRDSRRLDNIASNLTVNMGAGALAGTPINAVEYSKVIARVLKTYKGFAKGLRVSAITNSLDTVSDRDFIIEIISALSILATHLSRFSEDLIIWSTKEFDFVEIDEAFCTGSSLMPQKKNPDVLELIRGYTGRLYGNLVSVLTMMKGLPLAYNRDMQLDKEPLFNSFEIISSELKVFTGLIKALKFNKAKIEEQLQDESLYATDLVYYLVDRKIPFKSAHTIIGKLVKYSIDNDIQIKDMPEGLLRKFSGKFVKKEIVKLFDPLVSVGSKKSVKR